MKKLILELNEVNIDLLIEAGAKRKPISDILSKGLGSFSIKENYDSDYLEPWSQWVTVHTGEKTEIHKIKHLGDVSNLNYTQVWDKYPSNFNLIWGCLNSSPPKNENIIYFPDPWTRSSSPSRWYLKPLIKFLSFAVSKRSQPDFGSRLKENILIIPSVVFSLLLLLPFVDLKLLKSAFVLKFKIFNFSIIYAIVEYLIFKFAVNISSVSDKKDVIFINMIAHCQHYYWKSEKNYILDYCLDRVSDMVEIANKKYSEVIIFNGLSQDYSADKEDWHSWIPKGGWVYFINNVLKINCSVEPCMSYDTNLIFHNGEEINNAIAILKKINVNKTPLLLIENNPFDANKVFVRLNYFGSSACILSINEEHVKFESYFDLAAIRTGRHAQYSVIIGNGAEKFNKNSNSNEQAMCIYL